MEYRTIDDGRNHRREMLVEGELVCWLGIIDYTMRIGIAQVRMGGIEGVATKEQHRKKGYMRLLLNDTLTYMQTQGYDVSMLFGIPDFYPKFGYATCLVNSTFTIKTRIAETAVANAVPITTHPIVPGDLPMVIDLYNEHNATRNCSLVRSPQYFRGFSEGSGWWRKADSAIIQDSAGHFAGYCVWDRDKDEVSVTEAECVSPKLYASMLYEFARQAVEKRANQITFHMPPDHPFAIFARRYGACWTLHYPFEADGMLRIINQSSLFDKIAPVLQQRVVAFQPYALELRTDLGETTLRSSSTAPLIGSITLPQHRLIQLICGYRSVADAILEPDVKIEGDVLPLLDTMFPVCHAYVWHADHF